MKKTDLYSILVVFIFIITTVFINYDKYKNDKLHLQQITKQNQRNLKAVLSLIQLNNEALYKATKDNISTDKNSTIPQIITNHNKTNSGFNSQGYICNYLSSKDNNNKKIQIIYPYEHIAKLMKTIFKSDLKAVDNIIYKKAKTIFVEKKLKKYNHYKTYLPIYNNKHHIKTIIIKSNDICNNKYNNYIYIIFTVFSFLITTITLLFINEKNRSKSYQTTAMTDTLTNIANRLKFNTIFEQQIKIANRTQEKLCLILLDIDHFKHINDKYGHQVGDDILIQIVSIINKNIREADLFARWGGEEFVIIMPNTNIEDGIKVAQKLRIIIEQHIFRTKSYSINITISIGIGTYKPNEPKELFIKRVDLALYRAKNEGRNRVRIAYNDNISCEKRG